MTSLAVPAIALQALEEVVMLPPGFGDEIPGPPGDAEIPGPPGPGGDDFPPPVDDDAPASSNHDLPDFILDEKDAESKPDSVCDLPTPAVRT